MVSRTEGNKVALRKLNTKSNVSGTSLAVQWLRHHTPTEGAQVQPLVRELRSHMSCGIQKNRKNNNNKATTQREDEQNHLKEMEKLPSLQNLIIRVRVLIFTNPKRESGRGGVGCHSRVKKKSLGKRQSREMEPWSTEYTSLW